MNCQHCQPLLLDHLYGLLDGPDEAAVRAHLDQCPACAAARDEAARVGGLIARAAKSAFPHTRFEAPADEPAEVIATPAPAVPALPLAKPGRGLRLAAVVSWAVAAAVLVAIPGTVLPVLTAFKAAERATAEADGARREAARLAGDAELARAGALRRQTDAEFRVTVAEQFQTALLGQWAEAQKAALAAAARDLTIDVQKPATVQPGAPNEFVVVVNDERKQWERTGKRMVAEVHAVGASDAVIFTQPIDSEQAADKRHALRLPASVWTKVKPDAELFLVVAQVDEKTQARTELLERVKLAGPVFTTLLVTDKAHYRPGERLFFRSLTLDRISLRPPAREQVFRYELHAPNGRPVAGLSVAGTTELVRVGADGKVEPVRATDGAAVRGVGSGELVLPPDLADGDYTLVLRESPHPGGFPAAVAAPVARKVTVRSGQPDHFRKRLGFARGSFAAGETVEAWAELAFQDRPVPNAEVVAVAAEVDGRPVAAIDAPKATDANGRVTVRFALPPEVQAGDARLKVTFRTPPGTEEMVAKQVPVVGRRLNVEFFPECGDTLVAGVPCKVYVRATTPAGIAVDVRGVVTDGRRELARVETLTDAGEPGANRGLAAFTYTPELGTRVWLKLEAPAGACAPILPDVPVANAAVGLLGGAAATGARTGYPLPAPKAEGVVMSVLDPVTAPGEPIRARLHAVGQPRQLVVGAYTRGKLSDTQKVTVEPEVPQIVKLIAGADPRGGVVRVTAFEEPEDGGDLKPVAERLVFRKPGEVLKLDCAVATDGLGPAVPLAASPALESGALAKLSIAATDEKKNPAAAILWAAAVNSGAAPGPRDRLMPTHFLLAGEVQKPDELEYADFLLTDHPKAAEALDLLLGTQGWRRFAEQRPAPTDAARVQPAAGNAPAPTPEVVRLQAHNGQNNVLAEQPLLRENRRAAEAFGPRYEEAVQALARARQKLDEARAAAADPQPAPAAEALARAARAAAEDKAARADAAGEPVRAFRANVWYGVAGLFLLAAGCGAVAVRRPADRFPLGFSTLGALGLAAFLLVAAGWGDEARAAATGAARGGGDQVEAMSAEASTKQVAEERAMTRERNAQLAKLAAIQAQSAAEAKAETVAMAEVAATGLPSGFAPQKGGLGFGGAGGHPAKPGATGPAMGGMMPGAGGVDNIAPAKLTPSGGGPPAAPAPPAGPSVPVAPSPPGAAKHGTPGRRDGGVTPADLLNGRPTPFTGTSKGDADRFAEQADELKRAAARAVTYANDRSNTLTEAIDAYFRQRLRAKQGDAAAFADKATEVERLVAGQLRGAVARPQPPLVVREYAAPRPQPPLSADTSEDTVLWQPVIVLPADGKATLTFHLGAAPGGYQVVVAGHTADGRLGATRGLIKTTPPRTVGPDAAVPPAVAPTPPAP
jgi:hypothetical protein